MGITYFSNDIDVEEMGLQSPAFEQNEVQLLFRTYLRFAASYFRKVKSLGKSVSISLLLPS